MASRLDGESQASEARKKRTPRVEGSPVEAPPEDPPEAPRIGSDEGVAGGGGGVLCYAVWLPFTRCFKVSYNSETDKVNIL